MTDAEPEEQWKQSKTMLQETAAEAFFFFLIRKHNYWFDEADQTTHKLTEKKAFARMDYL